MGYASQGRAEGHAARLCYDWDHQEAATKEICISQIFYGETYKFVARVGPSVELVEHFVA